MPIGQVFNKYVTPGHHTSRTHNTIRYARNSTIFMKRNGMHLMVVTGGKYSGNLPM